jgi:hypothetical protein
MATDALRLADLENATQRFPLTEVYEYCNKGIAHVYAEMLVVGGPVPFFSDEAIITCTTPPAGFVATYPFPADFLQILSVSWCNAGNSPSGGPWIPLTPMTEAERTRLLNARFYGGIGPRHYGITGGPTAFTQGTIPVAYSIEILPNPTSNSLLRVRYVPTCPRLINPTDTFDGLLGFEDAATTWAAVLMRRKDDLDTADLERDMQKHFQRIHVIAKRRDRSSPPRVSIIRGRGVQRGGRNGFGGSGYGSL